MPDSSEKIAAVVLAGGRSRRMQDDKRLLPFGNTNLLNHCVQTLKKQCSLVLVNSNSAIPGCDLPLVTDRHQGTAGPLDGVISSLQWLTEAHPQYTHLLTAPVDCPFLPDDFAKSLWQARRPNTVVIAASDGRQHYTCALWPIELLTRLQNYFDGGGRAFKNFVNENDTSVVEFPTAELDPFFNINEPRDYHYALSLLQNKSSHP